MQLTVTSHNPNIIKGHLKLFEQKETLLAAVDYEVLPVAGMALHQLLILFTANNELRGALYLIIREKEGEKRKYIVSSEDLTWLSDEANKDSLSFAKRMLQKIEEASPEALDNLRLDTRETSIEWTVDAHLTIDNVVSLFEKENPLFMQATNDNYTDTIITLVSITPKHPTLTLKLARIIYETGYDNTYKLRSYVEQTQGIFRLNFGLEHTFDTAKMDIENIYEIITKGIDKFKQLSPEPLRDRAIDLMKAHYEARSFQTTARCQVFEKAKIKDTDDRFGDMKKKKAKKGEKVKFPRKK